MYFIRLSLLVLTLFYSWAPSALLGAENSTPTGDVSLPALGNNEFRLSNGNMIRGSVASFTEDGVVFRLDTGGFSERYHWIILDQSSLKKLATLDPELNKLVDPFIELPEQTSIEVKEIPIHEVDKVERVQEKPDLISAFFTPAGLIILTIIFVANIWAGYEIARFRHLPYAVVCSLSAIAPIVAPIIFLSIPIPQHFEEEQTEEEGEEPATVQMASAAPSRASARSARAQRVGMTKASSPAAAGGAATGSGGGASESSPKTFKRGETTFNRRFMETQFPAFFRAMPNEKQEMVVKVGKEEFISNRISRISATEARFQTLDGQEKGVPFMEITEIQVRNK